MNIFRLIYLSALFGVLFLHSCGGSGGDGPDDPQKPDLPPVVDFLDPSITSVVMGHLQDASAVVIRTNKPWSASSDADWLKLSASSGSGSTTIIVGASENKSFRRKSVVKIKAGSITRELVVVQKPAPRISLNTRGVSFTLLPVEADTVFRIEGNMYYETRDVYLSSYYISETEITCAQWAAVTGNLSGYNHYSMPYYPVLTNWNTIVNVFIPQINRLVGYDFRLPTEAEWYVAAKGGLKGKNYGYPGSTDPDEVAWHYKNSEGTLHRVGLKKKNELGLYDMAGNVAEWCGDWYREWSESNPPEKMSTNPKGPSSGTEKVVKGGDIDADKFEYQANSCRISSRNHLPPSSQIPAEYSEGRLYDFVGFRLVLSDAK